ncbi:MAG: LysR substrate-binding domain-containing protein, partial [Gemmatimonadaceae bacterium]
RRPALPLNSIAQYPMLATVAAGDFHDLLLQYFASEQLMCPQLELVGSIDAVKRAVQSSAQSLGILPAHAIASDLASGRFRGLNLNPLPPRVRLVALLPRTRVERHPAVGELLDALRQA